MAEIHRIGDDEVPASGPWPEALLRLRAVTQMTGISRTEIYRQIGAGRFPRPVQIGPSIIGWRQSDLVRWIAELPTQEPPRPPQAPRGSLPAAQARPASRLPQGPPKPKRRGRV